MCCSLVFVKKLFWSVQQDFREKRPEKRMNGNLCLLNINLTNINIIIMVTAVVIVITAVKVVTAVVVVW